jgi:hypothetical protein
MDLDTALDSKRVRRHYRYDAVHTATGEKKGFSHDFWNPDLFLWDKQKLEKLGWKITWCRAYQLHLSWNF